MFSNVFLLFFLLAVQCGLTQIVQTKPSDTTTNSTCLTVGFLVHRNKKFHVLQLFQLVSWTYFFSAWKTKNEVVGMK